MKVKILMLEYVAQIPTIFQTPRDPFYGIKLEGKQRERINYPRGLILKTAQVPLPCFTDGL